ncbi:Hpt domain-containing protein [Herbaspirillum sp. LeCh32-8]|uniref:hybrid sensor histidine kinase/response regulator n=1 Tax=Herbaspirillum sp. LeCh32-8 TaxID=2821356 RepID=UPI001AE88B1F|nr:Hpt domain-containing protein [Herbaspirillum sp. LeCh32-8]MBP0600485.1 Hpt domain-containing protein [Herbaspirillum sp. LeCh32-8]
MNAGAPFLSDDGPKTDPATDAIGRVQPQSRAQVSDNLRMLAGAMHAALEQLRELLGRVQGDGVLPPGLRAEATARLSTQVSVLALAGAVEPARMLAAACEVLETDPAAVVKAVWSLHDYLDALFDKSGDSDICNLLLFTACRRLQLIAGIAHAADAPASAAPDARARAAGFSRALDELHADHGHDATLAALQALERLLRDVPDLAFAHVFLGRLLDAGQPLDPHAIAVLDSLGVLLAAETVDPASMPVRLALARRRIDFLQSLASEEERLDSRPGEQSQQMLRLMLLADELQTSWDRCVCAGASGGRIGAAWQWCESVLRAAALSRRIWPRLRAPGLSGFLAALSRLAFDLAMSQRALGRDRELSSCLIFLDECLRRRLFLDDDFTEQIDCIVDHLAVLAYGEAEPDPFPWFSRELRADMARRMEGVVESALQGKLAQVQRALETLWSPSYIAAVRAAREAPGDEAALGVSPEVLLADMHAELAQIEDLSSHLRSSQMREQAAHLRSHIAAQLPATLQLSADIPDERTRRRGDGLRAGMVRDLVRLAEMLEQARRSPYNKWRRHPDADQSIADGAHLADEIRRALDEEESPVAVPAATAAQAAPAVAPGRPDDDAPGSWQPEDDDPEMLQIFLGEARQLLDGLQTELPQLAGGQASLELLTDVRRSFHTFKGSGRMVGLEALADVAHAIELLLNTCLTVARGSGRVQLPAAVMELLSQARARLDGWVGELAAHGRSRRQAPSLVAAALALRSSVAAAVTEDEDARSADGAAAGVANAVPSAVPAAMPPAAPTQAISGRAHIDSPALRDIFLTEARNLFKLLRQHGSSWRAKADSGLVTGAPPLYSRAAHTLRGCSAAAGFEGMQRMAEALDELLERRKAAATGLDAAELAVVERAVDAMLDMLDQYAAGEFPAACAQSLQELASLMPGAASPTPPQAVAPPVSPPSAAPELQDEIDHELLPVFLEEGHDLLAAVGENLQRFQRDPSDQAALIELRRALHTVKGSARMTGALRLGHRMHELESGIQRLLSRRQDAPGIDALLALFDQALSQFDALEHLGAEPRTGAPVHALSEGERKLASPLVRIKAAVLDRLLNHVGEVSIARSQLENEVLALHRSSQELADNIAKLSAQLRDVEIQAEIQIAASHHASSDSAQFDPLELDRFTHLQELTRMMAESVNDAASLQKQLLDSASKTQDGLQMQERLTRELQRELMYARMMKFRSLEQRLQHLARQLGGETGKPLELQIAGGDMEIDRVILERLVGPLEHLLRNAAVHGIEDAAARAAADKPAVGGISVQAAVEGNEAVIRVSDDGRGLDFAAIRRRGITLGLLPADAQCDDAAGQARLAELIFEPGFSTSEQLSALAGRGVGADVVRSEVAALGGRITVHSTPGAGVRFTMHLPLSLAVNQVCLLRHGGQSYAIPSMLIDKVVQLRGEQMRQALAQRATVANGRMVTLHSLHSLLDEPHEEQRLLHHPSLFIVFVKSGNDLLAIMVDHVVGNREVVAKPLGPQMGSLVGVLGATVLGNGEIVLVINPLLLLHRPGARRMAIQREAQVVLPAQPAQKIIMVVDDSLTVRKVMQRLLAREGYEVVTAADGYDAIGQLHDITPDTFLVDIEMPRMDGFTLVRHLRDNPATHAKPIVMITSRTGAKHRERAMEVGVNYYLGKPYQDEQLLELIRHYTLGAGERPADDFSDVLY